MQLDHDVKHEALAVAEEIVDAIFPRNDPRHTQTRHQLERRLEAFAAAILNQVAKAAP